MGEPEESTEVGHADSQEDLSTPADDAQVEPTAEEAATEEAATESEQAEEPADDAEPGPS